MKRGNLTWSLFRVPFELKEVPVSKDFRPKLEQEYLIEYKWPKDEKSIFLVGRFNRQWYGYTFCWFWGSSSLQLSTQEHSKDYQRFLGIWELTRTEPKRIEDPPVNFVTKEEMNI